MAAPRYVPFFDQGDQRNEYKFTWLSQGDPGEAFEFDERHREYCTAKRLVLAKEPEAIWADADALPQAARNELRDHLVERLVREHPATFRIGDVELAIPDGHIHRPDVELSKQGYWIMAPAEASPPVVRK